MLLRIISVLAFLPSTCSAFAEDNPKPNTLTPKEIAEGWILLFDGETTYGWNSSGNNDSHHISVKNGVLTTARTENKIAADAMFLTRFRYFELVGEYRSKTENSSLGFQIDDDERDDRGCCYTHRLKQTDEWQPFRVTSNPGKITAVIGEPKRSSTNTVNEKNSLAWIMVTHPFKGTGSVDLRNLKLRPLETKPLFNGKDLTGWTVNKSDPKRVASKWEVTKDGELSLKNGPGDLQSDKEFDNFVLQVECKTLGTANNSGVFFRCMPGQYQNGYEAQIQNSFKGDDRTKPTDFGTGAIYRRIPARKVVSNDNEWFTMTVVAAGKHIATWVNGYQTVDWNDDRPANDNPRNGYRTAKGPLSLQGHDPTTDLLFRNIRIAELQVVRK